MAQLSTTADDSPAQTHNSLAQMNDSPAQPMLPVTGRKFFLLFLFLLTYLALYPYMGSSGVRYYLFRLVSAALTLMCVYAVSFRKGLIYVALALAIPSIVEHAIVFRPRLVPASVVPVILSFAFDVFTIVIIFRRVFVRESRRRRRSSAPSASISSSDFPSPASTPSSPSSSLMPSIWIPPSICIPFLQVSISSSSALEA